MFGAVYQCYLCIFLIAETDMIAARIIFYKMQADSSMNRGLESLVLSIDKEE